MCFPVLHQYPLPSYPSTTGRWTFEPEIDFVILAVFLFIIIEVCEITEVLFPSKQYKNCSFGVTLSDSDTEYVFSAEVLIRPHMEVFPKCCADSDISSRKVYQKILPDHSGEILTLQY